MPLKKTCSYFHESNLFCTEFHVEFDGNIDFCQKSGLAPQKRVSVIPYLTLKKDDAAKAAEMPPFF